MKGCPGFADVHVMLCFCKRVFDTRLRLAMYNYAVFEYFIIIIIYIIYIVIDYIISLTIR